MFKLLRRPSPYQTALAMIGAKSGDRVLVTGGHDHGLAAAVALVTGLNGQTVALASPEASAAVEAAANKAGALVEFAAAMPHHAAFDIGVWQVETAALAGSDAPAKAATLIASLRTAGRLIVMARSGGGTLFRKPEEPDDRAIIALLQGVGAKAVRALGSADAVTYYEARKGLKPGQA